MFYRLICLNPSTLHHPTARDLADQGAAWTLVLPAAKGNGLQVSTRYARKNGACVAELRLENTTAQPLNQVWRTNGRTDRWTDGRMDGRTGIGIGTGTGSESGSGSGTGDGGIRKPYG